MVLASFLGKHAPTIFSYISLSRKEGILFFLPGHWWNRLKKNAFKVRHGAYKMCKTSIILHPCLTNSQRNPTENRGYCTAPAGGNPIKPGGVFDDDPPCAANPRTKLLGRLGISTPGIGENPNPNHRAS